MRQIYLSICFLLLIAGIVGLQFQFDQDKKTAIYPEPFIVSAPVVKAADLGLDNASADLFWLLGIQYFGSGTSKTNEKLASYLNLATDLDPKFAYPYAFGALLLPSIGQTDQGVSLALKGIRRNVPDYRIPYYLAATYHINLSDTKSAAFYFDLAARTPGAPPNIQKVAANYGARPDLRSQTKDIWQGIYDTTSDEVVKEMAAKYLNHFDLLDALENLSKLYKEKNGHYPTDVNQLVAEKILPNAPIDPFGFQFKFNQENGRAEIK
ncbi:MAG: hypothetical protein NTW50_01140 [Candidatus Berkelbacteria bacterium]|nr:hypothetical protein [Candidatus Berkelbacteria bacterium]